MRTTRFFTFLTTLVLTLSAYAYDFQSGDLYYNITSSTEPYIAEVTSSDLYRDNNYPGLTNALIPSIVSSNGVTYNVAIGSFAFENCSSLTSVTIPANVTSIGERAFNNTPWWNSKPDGLVYINNILYTYKGIMPANTSVMIADGTTAISASAFSNCSGLTSIKIPASVTHVENWVFDGCTALTTFICEGNPIFDFDDSDGEYLSVLSLTPNLDSVVGPASIFDVPELGWSRLPKKIRYIKVTGGELFNDAFAVINRSYKTLNTLDLAAATNTQLADEAFKDCYALENLQLPFSLERIGYMSVANCKNLKSVHVPASVTDIDDSAFENCRSITSLTFGNQADKSRQRSVSSNSQLQRIGSWSFYNCHNLQSLTIPEGVTEIGSAAFYGCTYLQDLTLPGSLQQIGDNCFALCSKLNYINVNATIPPTIESKTFADVNRTIPLYVPAGSLGAYQSDIYWSEFMNVTEAPTAIKPVTIIEGVYAQNGAIVVDNDTNLPVAIYDVVGRLVASGLSFTQHFEVPNAGVYLVKVGEQTMKVLVP